MWNFALIHFAVFDFICTIPCCIDNHPSAVNVYFIPCMILFVGCNTCICPRGIITDTKCVSRHDITRYINTSAQRRHKRCKTKTHCLTALYYIRCVIRRCLVTCQAVNVIIHIRTYPIVQRKHFFIVCRFIRRKLFGDRDYTVTVWLYRRGVFKCLLNWLILFIHRLIMFKHRWLFDNPTAVAVTHKFYIIIHPAFKLSVRLITGIHVNTDRWAVRFRNWYCFIETIFGICRNRNLFKRFTVFIDKCRNQIWFTSWTDNSEYLYSVIIRNHRNIFVRIKRKHRTVLYIRIDRHIWRINR